jgi:hypothetical protein
VVVCQNGKRLSKWQIILSGGGYKWKVVLKIGDKMENNFEVVVGKNVRACVATLVSNLQKLIFRKFETKAS